MKVKHVALKGLEGKKVQVVTFVTKYGICVCAGFLPWSVC